MSDQTPVLTLTTIYLRTSWIFSKNKQKPDFSEFGSYYGDAEDNVNYYIKENYEEVVDTLLAYIYLM